MIGTIEPLFDLVLVRKTHPTDVEEVQGPDGNMMYRRKDSGIVMPLAHLEQRPEAEVTAVGPDVKYVKKGDKVIMGKFSGQIMDDYILVPEEGGILAKIT